MHYTSIENIHRVIDPLFLDGLRHGLEAIMDEPSVKKRLRLLHGFQNRLTGLRFLDPACGSGNFLTESYLSLRRLENEVIKAIYSLEPMDAFVNPIKVSINQFYGIEVNDFAVTVAATALWISESQMMAETEKIIHHDIDFLPLRSYANIREGNALRMEWDKIELPEDIPTIRAGKTYVTFEPAHDVAGDPQTEYAKLNLVTGSIQQGPAKPQTETVRFDYIMGNPPFVGARMMARGSKQKKDIEDLFGKIKDVQDLDYVSGWYKKAAEVIQGTNTEVGFVSTNSICQGSQVPILWDVLLNRYGIKINFAYQTFRWDNESSNKAAVHCVIIGFAAFDRTVKSLYISGAEHPVAVSHINPYLLPSDDILIRASKEPLCDVPKMNFGNQPRDGGNFIFTEDEYRAALKEDPMLAHWFRRYMGAEEFINGKSRWCLWLKDVSPSDIRKHKLLYERVRAVREFRMASKAKTTNGYAKVPYLFAQITQPEGTDYLIIPRTSSESRRYIPIGFETADVISSDAVHLIPNATLYHFGVLQSNVHMAWTRTVCGRLEMRYRYSKEIVYNNFPWPSPTAEQRQRIEQTARGILDARAKYPDSSLADLYDPTTMPHDLLEAHRANDRAVMAAYGFPTRLTESECVARLFGLYSQLAGRP